MNDGSKGFLSIGKDEHRLASAGDFNIEIDYTELLDGINTVTVIAVDSLQNRATKEVKVHYTSGRSWSLPYEVDWSSVKNVQDAVQIVDGHWKLVEGGLRTVLPYYDRVIAVGDIRDS